MEPAETQADAPIYPIARELERYLTVNAYAAQIGVTRRTVYRWIAAGRLPVRRTAGGSLRIPHPPDLSPGVDACGLVLKLQNPTV